MYEMRKYNKKQGSCLQKKKRMTRTGKVFLCFSEDFFFRITTERKTAAPLPVGIIKIKMNEARTSAESA